MKHNKGFTLVEMVVTILAASVITAAALSILLLGMRVHQKTSSPAANQSSISLGISILEDLVAESAITSVGAYSVSTNDGVLFSYDGTKKTVYIGDFSGTPLLEAVDKLEIIEFDAKTRMLEFEITINNNKYVSRVYSRTDPNSTVPTESIPEESGESNDDTNNNVEIEAAASAAASSCASPKTLSDIVGFNALDRQNFLNILTAEEGSTGMSSSGEYFSEWYIGSYQDNPDWNPDTPWCACFISWALDRCRSSLEEVPRYAHVDKFMDSFDEDHWKTENPDPGDIIFFDWIVNDVSAPQHVGVVVSTDGEFVCTIEGNNEGKVASCRYRLDDARILGYGVLRWR